MIEQFLLNLAILVVGFVGAVVVIVLPGVGIAYLLNGIFDDDAAAILGIVGWAVLVMTAILTYCGVKLA